MQPHLAYRYCAVITFDNSSLSWDKYNLDEMELSQFQPPNLLAEGSWEAGYSHLILCKKVAPCCLRSQGAGNFRRCIPIVSESERFNPHSSNGVMDQDG
jgi:hypothetical protein